MTESLKARIKQVRFDCILFVPVGELRDME